MTGSSVLCVLLGGAIAWATVIASALADRIRDGRRELRLAARDARERVAVRASAPAVAERAPEPADVARDVIAGLVKMGYGKDEASAAVHACPATDRHTPENWMRCAMRRTLAKRTV